MKKSNSFYLQHLSHLVGKQLGLPVLSGYEEELRKGQADDALCGLRRALKYKENLQWGKRKSAHGNANNTRAVVLIRRAHDLVRLKVTVYRRARDALLRLGMSEKDGIYKPLEDAHVVLKKVKGYPDVGDTQYTGSWIWVEGPRGSSPTKKRMNGRKTVRLLHFYIVIF